MVNHFYTSLQTWLLCSAIIPCYTSLCNSSSSQWSIPLTPHFHVGTSLTPVSSRGSYQLDKRIPQQTLHNQKKQKLSSGIAKEIDENLQHLENYRSGVEEIHECLDNDHGHSCPVDVPILKSDTSSPLTNKCADSWSWRTPKTYVFPGSSLTVDTSNMLLRSFMCCHHLTHRAKIDLLQLLQIHLPEDSQVPSSLYMFEKKCAENSPDCSPEVTEHYYYSDCNTSLTGPLALGVLKDTAPLTVKWKMHHFYPACMRKG